VDDRGFSQVLVRDEGSPGSGAYLHKRGKPRLQTPRRQPDEGGVICVIGWERPWISWIDQLLPLTDPPEKSTHK
jgi:hypothetical protein